MNLKFIYLYRDGSNYKRWGSIIFENPGMLSPEEFEGEIKKCLIEETWFYSTEWDLPDLHFDKFDFNNDHFYHEFDRIEYTDESANSNKLLREFLEKIREIGIKYK